MKRQGGFGLIEIVVGLAILAISFFTLMMVGRNVTKLSFSTTKSLQAAYLLEEGIEVARFIRDHGWGPSMSALSGTSSLAFDSTWTVTTTPEVIDNLFYRTITVAPVSRISSGDNTNDDITLSGGINDPGTKKITVVVSWKIGQATTSISASTYLTNYFND